ncbi:MAG: hypothetical protein R6X02_29215 [Enhygromyxa sp.]
MKRLPALGFAAVMFGGLGCGWNYTPSDNLLPDPKADGDDTEDEGPPPETGETGETGGLEEVPATYRLDCVDIQMLGDADPSVFQVATLQNTWAADVANFKLNILIDLLTEDPDAGSGTVTIRSGIGGGWSDQCTLAQTDSAEFPVAVQPGVTEWAPSSAEGACAAPAQSGGSSTYTLELGPEELVYIYAEDDDGTAFNCSASGAGPDAIPIAALSATISGTEDRSRLAGTLTGCMAQSEAENVCSCLSVCSGTEHPSCPGCPGGAVPLGLLLGGVNPTPYCSDLLGEPAFDVILEFSARRLPGVPSTCG